MGVMNGLQNDLREKILIGSPDIRVLTWGEDMVMNDWEKTLENIRAAARRRGAGPVRAHAGAGSGRRHSSTSMRPSLKAFRRTAPVFRR